MRGPLFKRVRPPQRNDPEMYLNLENYTKSRTYPKTQNPKPYSNSQGRSGSGVPITVGNFVFLFFGGGTLQDVLVCSHGLGFLGLIGLGFRVDSLGIICCWSLACDGLHSVHSQDSEEICRNRS